MLSILKNFNKKIELLISLYQQYPFSDALNTMYLDAKIGGLLTEVKNEFKEIKTIGKSLSSSPNKNKTDVFDLKIEIMNAQMNVLLLYDIQGKEMMRLFSKGRG